MHIVMTLSIPDGTGAMAMMAAFARAFRRHGHDVTLAHGPIPPGQARLDSRANLMLTELRAAGVDLVPVPGLPATYRRRASQELAELARRIGADVFVGFHQSDRKHAIRAAGTVGIPVVISAQNQHRFWGPRPVRWAKARAYARLLRSAELVVCTSTVVRAEVVGRFGVDDRRAPVLPNGIEVPPSGGADRSEARSRLGLHDTDLVAINVGRLDVQKGHDVLLDALGLVGAELDDHFRMVIVGGVPESKNQERMKAHADALRARAEQDDLAGRVRFTGWRDDVRELLSAADFYVHASRWEGFALAALEAMAASLPVIITDCSGIPPGFEPGVHGFIARTGSAESLADAIRAMLAMTPDERSEMGRRARRLLEEHFDVVRIADRFVDLTAAAVGQARTNPEWETA